MQSLAERNGIPLSVGELESDSDTVTPTFATEDEGPQPVDVAARVIAHLTHRIPGLRKIGKKVEGQDKRSGVLSDAAALGATLYARNERVFKSAIRQWVAATLAKRAAKVNSNKGGGNSE